jgi:hypothetical protein
MWLAWTLMPLHGIQKYGLSYFVDVGISQEIKRKYY